MSTDQFTRQYREAQDRVERLRNQIFEINNARPGQSVASQKYLMKATWATLQTDMMNFDQLKETYTNEPHKIQESKKEIARRIELIKVIQDLVSQELAQEYRAVENNQAALAAAQERARYDKGEDGEFDQTRDLDNRQVLMHQKQMLKDQDNDLDEVIGVVKATKYEA